VRTHPETGKRALMYAAQFLRRIKDMSDEESRAIVGFLDNHVKDPSLHCRWRWSVGDLAVWDERSTLHRAAADHFPYRRVVRRLEIDGDRPYFDAAAGVSEPAVAEHAVADQAVAEQAVPAATT
jgi:taurine dioxygenase